MKKITVGEVAKAVNGRLLCGDENTIITGVEIDSRIMKENDCFFALEGERADGHDFIRSAFEKGAVCAVVSNEEKSKDIVEAAEGKAVILTENAEEALRSLAAWYIRTFNIKKIAVTGSNGKTTTKDMTHAVCSVEYKTQKTPVNRNNLIGLPLTVLSLEEDTEVAVFEMGMDNFNEISRMAAIVEPDIAIITNVGTAHIERLGSREGILKAKLEITETLKPCDVLIIPDGGDMLTRESAEGDYRLVTIGTDGRSDYVVSGIENLGENGVTFSVEHDGKLHKIKLPVPGEYNVSNATLAIAAADELGISIDEAAKGLLEFKASEKRMNIRGANGIKVIDDTYNASPPAVKAAVDVLMSTSGVRKVAILGDMFELGEKSDDYHREVGIYAAEKGVQMFVGVGSRMRFACEGARSILGNDRVLHFNTKEEFTEVIRDVIRSGDVVLVKGSRGMAMEEVVRKILE